jgi:DNA-binding NarL/FixJ family response regulator
MNDNDILIHYGTPRHSGRYPWGSGDNPYQHEGWFLSKVDELQKKGLSEKEIAKELDMTTTELRARKSNAKSERAVNNYYEAVKLRNKGWSYDAIAQKLGYPNESSVRTLLKRDIESKTKATSNTVDILKKSVSEKGYIDVGLGVESQLGVSQNRLKNAVQKLKDEGYTVETIYIEQLGTGNRTTYKVLAAPGTSWIDIQRNKDKISLPVAYVERETGKTKYGLDPIKNIDHNRILVRYAEDGGTDKDGVIELRRNVPDLDMGSSRYAQVRIGVDGTHYLKGMAMYTDDIPDGYDIIFNTNKTKGTPMLGDKDNSVLKPMKNDPDNPFGATIKLGGQKGALNIVNEEGDWGEWSKTLSSQFLSKQSSSLAKQQLKIVQDERKEELRDILTVTNPVIKKKLLLSFADGCDKDAEDLKAAALPRQATHVILPIPNMKENEIYAPKYKDGEQVVLVRYPHAGIFEIPTLTVNNKQKDAKRLISGASDAVGINAKVAERLSGADFDGDTVLVIPTAGQKIKTSKPLEGLTDFSPTRDYPGGVAMGLPEVGKPKKEGGDGFRKGFEMGSVSNLITDMTLAGATDNELTRAVKHSMVVIDAEKHQLDWKKSERDNDIRGLKLKYQGGERAGAATLISQASGEARVNERKQWYLSKDTIDEDGNKIYKETGRTYTDKNGKVQKYQTVTTRMAEAKDAFELSSGSLMESIYAKHANILKFLANEARKEAVKCAPLKKSQSAADIYANEVASIRQKLTVIRQNKPLERQAQLKANIRYFAKQREAKADGKELSNDDKKKIRNQLLNEARLEVGSISKRQREMVLTDKEWEAINAGAFSGHELSQVIDNMDLDEVKQRATPRTDNSLSSSKVSRINNMYNMGYTQAEIAERIGVSASTVEKYIER